MKLQFPKIALTALAATFAISTAHAANIPKYCAEEIITISRMRCHI